MRVLDFLTVVFVLYHASSSQPTAVYSYSDTGEETNKSDAARNGGTVCEWWFHTFPGSHEMHVLCRVFESQLASYRAGCRLEEIYDDDDVSQSGPLRGRCKGRR